VAAEVLQFTATIPHGTPTNALAVVKMPMTNYVIESVDLEVPPGPSGLMGFYLALSGEQWIPHSPGQFIVWDDRFDSWSLTEQPTSYGWEVHGYNTDVYDHVVIVRFHLNLPVISMTPPPPPTLTFVTTPSAQVPVTL
jgi:hypothetical protein